MSDNKLNLLIQFSSDGLGKLGDGLKNIVGLGKKGTTSLRNLKRESGKLQRELNKVGNELKTSGMQAGMFAERERRLQLQLAKTNREIAKQKKLLAIDARTGKMVAAGERMKSQGRSDMMQGATILAPIIMAAKHAGEFSSGMVDIAQKANLTDKATDNMANNILAASKAARQMPTDMQAAVEVLSGKGLDPRQAVKMLPAIGQLGTAFKVELADGASAAYSNMLNFNIGLNQTSRAFDIMAAAGNAGAFEIRDMARHFPELTAKARALGQSGLAAVSDLSAALQIAEKGTGNADAAATSISNLMTQINTERTIKKFAKFGVDLPAAMKKAAADGIPPLEAIAKITNDVTKGDMSLLPQLMGNQQAAQGLLALVQNMDEYRKIRKDAFNAKGTVGLAMQSRLARDATVNWRSFMGSASRLGIVMGTHVLPILTKITDAVGNGIEAIAAWAKENPRAAKAVMYLVGGLGALKIGLGALRFAFGGLLGPIAKAWGWFSKMRQLGHVAKVFGVLRTAVMFLAKGVMRAGLLMMANPMVAAIVALVAVIGFAGYMIYKHWGTIKAAFFTAVAWLQALGPKMMSIGVAIINGLANGIASAPGKVWNALKNVVMGGIGKVKEWLGINSPSRLFMGFGDNINTGLQQGLDKTRRKPIKAMGRVAAGVAGTALAAPAIAAGSGAGGGGGGGVTFNIYQQPGEDSQDLAERIARIMQRQQGRDARSTYQDEY